MARPDHAGAGFTLRCAIYTRKSSDEGLDQEFNSLDAQLNRAYATPALQNFEI
jgi:site-specific DNA recombinase